MQNIFNISFECFPPKTPEGLQNLTDAASLLANCRPEYISVTFGAGGSTREGTIDTVRMLQHQTHAMIVPHISCLCSTRDQLVEILKTYQTMGVTRIVALRGDRPSGSVETGDFKFASDLVKLIREMTGDYFHIYVAAYPEIHPQALSVKEDVLNLKRKLEAGANSAITQYFFNPDAYFYYLDDCVRYGINMPIVPGIMPITQFARLQQFSNVCGAEIPLWIRKRLEAYGDDMEALQQFGIEVVYNLCQRLIAGGAPGLHFYTLNKAEASVKILNLLNVSAVKVIAPDITK